MNVLVACEESQRVCIAFRERGHQAFSCDIIDCSGGHPEWHIKQDVLPLLNGNCEFETCDGNNHKIDSKWDLIIAHPPCTRLCTSGQRWLYYGDKKYRSQKISEQQKAIVFFMRFAFCDCDKVAIENPQGIMSTAYKKPDCIYNPYDFEGETECKKTCLWLKGLTKLKPTRKEPLQIDKRTQGIWQAHFDGKCYAWNDPKTAKLRSQTPLGVAKAMAEQWG
ncbi:MAG: hypothetical protein KBS62_00340 [Oscillospiraceae bacterium]|nr:hypothetical protein [Candidatus Ruminococcus equi]